MADEILIQGGTVLSMDPTVGDHLEGDILVRDDSIVQVGSSIDAPDADVIDARGMIVIPGFVDTHRHTWQCLTRQIGSDWTLADYFTVVRGKLGWHYTPEDLYAAQRLGRLEALDAGITTMLDWSHLINTPEHADAAVEGLRALPARSVFAYGDSNEGWYELPSPIEMPDDIKRVRDEHFADNTGLVSMAAAVRGPQFSTLDVTEHDMRMARDLDLRITVHVGDGDWGIRYPAVDMLQERDLLGSDTTYVHCTTCTDDHLRKISDTGGTASVAPAIEMMMGHGFPATGRLTRAGVRPSLSIDVVSVNGGDMFSVMRAALTCERALCNDAALQRGEAVTELELTTRDVLEFATIQGARACGLEDVTGSLTPGKQADIVLLDTSTPATAPLTHPSGTAVLAADRRNVDTVMVAGHVLKRDGVLVGIDQAAVLRDAELARNRVLQASGLPERALDWDFVSQLD